MTLRLGRTHAYLIAGLVLAFVLGFGSGRGLFRGHDEPERAGGAAPLASSPPTVAGASEPELPGMDIEGRPSRGPADAPVTIVEFTDYECPFCRRHFQQTYPKLLATYGDEVKYVVRNLPLTNIHRQAEKAAEAAECAYDQGRFWEYHDRLFSRAPALGADSLARYAAELRLDESAFTRCLESGAKREAVLRDVRAAIRLGLTGTPTFFINGRRLVGAQPLPVFRSFIDEALRTTETGKK
ncbi:MAG: DsbA family protein [Gemmatimonadota bacterium]